MGGLFSNPKIPTREVDPELERLKAEEQKRLDEETAAVDKKKETPCCRDGGTKIPDVIRGVQGVQKQTWL